MKRVGAPAIQYERTTLLRTMDAQALRLVPQVRQFNPLGIRVPPAARDQFSVQRRRLGHRLIPHQRHLVQLQLQIEIHTRT